MYAIDPYEAKFQLLINKWECIELKHLSNFKALIENANDMDNIYNNIEEYNKNKELKILIVFDDMIVDILSNKKHLD